MSQLYLSSIPLAQRAPQASVAHTRYSITSYYLPLDSAYNGMYNLIMPMPVDKKMDIAAQLAAGVPQRVIAAQYGTIQPTISKIANKDEVRALVEQLREELITECGAKAKENIREFIHSTDPDDKDYKFKASVKVMESIGALASHTQAVTINNLYAQHNDIHLSEASRAAMAHLSPGDIIDVDPFEDGS